MSGQSRTFRELKVEDALLYLDQVKAEFGNRPDIYNEFLEIMKAFKSQEIDTPGVIDQVSTLFRGYGKLIYGFNTFLPEGYKIDVPIELREQVRGEPPRHIVSSQQQSESWQHGDTTTSNGATQESIIPTGSTSPMQAGVAVNTSQQRPPLPAASTNPGRSPGPPGSSRMTTSNERRNYTEEQQPPPTAAATTAATAGGGPVTTGGSDRGGRHQPPEFDNAIAYVTAIKKRFAKEPETYKAFLEVLHTYQREQKGIEEVLTRVAELFKDHSDLLREFTYFLPDAAIEPAQRLILQRAADDADQRKRQRAMAKPRRGSANQQQQQQQQQQRGGGSGLYPMSTYPTGNQRQPPQRNIPVGARGLTSASSKRGGPRKQQAMPISVNRGPSLAQLRNAARSARQTARNQLAELERQKQVANAPRVQEAELVRRVRYALLGDRGHLFPPADFEERDNYLKKIAVAPVALLERSSVWRLEEEEDDEDKDEEDAEIVKATKNTKPTQRQIHALQQPIAQQTQPQALHRAAVWRDVLRVLEQVTRGALDGEAAEILLMDALDSCIDWGEPALCGSPSGASLAQDLALLVKPSSRLGPSIECAHQSVSLARKALAPGRAPDPKLLEADLEQAHALAKARGTLDRGLLQLQKQQLQRLNMASVTSYKPASQAYIKKSNASTRAATRRAQRAANRAASPASDLENLGLSAADDDDNDNDTAGPSDVFPATKAPADASGAESAVAPAAATESSGANEKEDSAEKKTAAAPESSLAKLVGQASTKFPGDWTSLPLSELDFMDEEEQMANHERTPSYRRLPDSVPRAVCSYRSETDASVLNDDFVSVATSSDDANYSQLHLRRNAHEEALFKAEDEHFEIDMVVHANSSAIRALEAIARHGGQDPQWTDAEQPSWEPQYLDSNDDRIVAMDEEDDDEEKEEEEKNNNYQGSRVVPKEESMVEDEVKDSPEKKEDEEEPAEEEDDVEEDDEPIVAPASSERPKRSARRTAFVPPQSEEKVVRHRRNSSETNLGGTDPPQSQQDSVETGRGRKRALSEEEVIAFSSSSTTTKRRGTTTRGSRSPALPTDADLNKRPIPHGTPALNRRGISPIQLAAICRVYGDRDTEALRALRNAPKAAAGVIAQRLREKDLEWRVARRGLARRWRRRCRAHFAKSLDHRAHFWRALDKKRCSNKWLVQEIKDVDCEDQDEAASGGDEMKAVPSLHYNISCPETRRDALKILMQALESSPCGTQERRAIARDLWRDFAADLLSILPQWLAMHLPQSLSRLEMESKLSDYIARKQRAAAAADDQIEEQSSDNMYLNSNTNGDSDVDMEDAADTLNERDDQSLDNNNTTSPPTQDDDAADETYVFGRFAHIFGDDLRWGSRLLTPYGPGIVFKRQVNLLEKEDDDEIIKIPTYGIKFPWGQGFFRARDIFGLDESTGTQYAPAELADLVLTDETTDNHSSGPEKSSSLKKKGSPRGAVSTTGGGTTTKSRSTRRRGKYGEDTSSQNEKAKDEEARVTQQTRLSSSSSPAAVKGAVFANEKLYVFIRLFQMVYDRLENAKRLCRIQTDRKAKANAEPHEVIDAIAADEQGEPPADSDSDDDNEEDLISRAFNGGLASSSENSAAAAKNNSAIRPPANNTFQPPSPMSPLFDFDEEIQRCCQLGYVGFLELVGLLLCGDVNKSTFDDACRELLGNEGYSVRAIDRLARATVDAMRALATDEAFKTLRDMPVDLIDSATTTTPNTLDTVRREIGNCLPSMAGEDLYRVSVDRDPETGHPKTLDFEFLGTLPETDENQHDSNAASSSF